MRIESYYFGAITVNGKEYTTDIIIYPDRIVDDWHRKEGHMLELEDIKEIIASNPEMIIIGTGRYGVLKIALEVKDFLRNRDIELIAFPTDKVCRIYNELRNKEKVVIALHLTC